MLVAAFAIESRTNPRLRDQAGELSLVPRADYLLGEGASPVMAAFTHIGKPSRFKDGSFGVYYAANTVKTALAEVKFHRERFMTFTKEPPAQLVMRSYVGTLKRPLHDIRASNYKRYHNPDVATYPRCQKFSAKIRATGAWGLLNRSVRDPQGECAAIYRPPAVGIPVQGEHYVLHWDGAAISHIYKLREMK